MHADHVATVVKHGVVLSRVCDHQGRANALKPGPHLVSHGGDFGVAGHLQHGHRIHEADNEAACRIDREDIAELMKILPDPAVVETVQ